MAITGQNELEPIGITCILPLHRERVVHTAVDDRERHARAEVFLDSRHELVRGIDDTGSWQCDSIMPQSVHSALLARSEEGLRAIEGRCSGIADDELAHTDLQFWSVQHERFTSFMTINYDY